MMKILFYLTRYPGIGGIEMVTSLITGKLLQRGYEVEVVSHIQQNADIQDITIFFFPDGEQFDTPYNRQFFNELLASRRYDLIVYQDSYAPSERIVVAGALKYNVPLLVFEHSSPHHIRIQNYPPLLSVRGFLARLNFTRILRYTFRKRYLIRACNRYVLLSESYKSELQKYVGKKNMCKVEVINNPLKECDNSVVSKENIILFVGRMVDTKRVDSMLDVWSRLAIQLLDWRLILVGDGPKRIELQSRAVHIPRVEFVGFQDPVPFYKKSRIFLMMSKFEGWPMTLCEAMQYGCVPVALDTYASLHDIIADGETGFVVPPHDINQYIKIIGTLALDSNLYERISAASRLFVKRFSVDKIVDLWEQLLASALNN